VKAWGQYLLALVAGVGVAGAVVWVLADDAGRRTVLVSGAIVLVVQLLAFAIARMMRDKQMMLGWGLGSLLRFFALVLYALIVARLWRAQVAPALLSFVAMLFVTTVVEPLFLKR
jgi:hypothetical protein